LESFPAIAPVCAWPLGRDLVADVGGEICDDMNYSRQSAVLWWRRVVFQLLTEFQETVINLLANGGKPIGDLIC
jgi:hypothetical protein